MMLIMMVMTMMMMLTIDDHQVMKRVKEGYRPEKPEHCDREIYNMMFYCWDKDPAERPSFSQLVIIMMLIEAMMVLGTIGMVLILMVILILMVTQVKDLEALLTKDTDYIDLNQFPDHAYYNEVTL